MREAVDTAGMGFDLHLWCFTSEASTAACELNAEFDGMFVVHDTAGENLGQHVVMNQMIDRADNDGYDKLLRLDDDVKFATKRWLFKLVEASELLGDNFIISPVIVGLRFPPDCTQVVEQNGVKFRVLFDAIGGICRLHPVDALCNPNEPYVSDVRNPMGFGDATGIAAWCKVNMEKHGTNIWMVYLETVRVKHAKGTVRQVKDQEEYHNDHNLFQTIPYIPMYKPTNV